MEKGRTAGKENAHPTSGRSTDLRNLKGKSRQKRGGGRSKEYCKSWTQGEVARKFPHFQ